MRRSEPSRPDDLGLIQVPGLFAGLRSPAGDSAECSSSTATLWANAAAIRNTVQDYGIREAVRGELHSFLDQPSGIG